MSATLTVFDVHGRIVRKFDGNYAQGYNEIVLKGIGLNIPGVYYYQLNACDFTASRKIIFSLE
jgi:hypothetical protein